MKNILSLQTLVVKSNTTLTARSSLSFNCRTKPSNISLFWC
ncbi:TPA: class III lanthipeptide [Streptococcus suis]|nr:class III lanthipeptide [Streptococcus suis]